MKFNIYLLLAVVIQLSCFSVKSFATPLSGPRAGTLQFCYSETGALYNGGKASLSSKSCYFGADFIERYPTASDDIIGSACKTQSVQNICLQAIWAYKRILNGASSAYKSAEMFCAAETGASRGSGQWSLSSLSCYFGVDFIEHNPTATNDFINFVCTSKAQVPQICLQSVWAYKRAIKGASSAYIYGEEFCAAKTGVFRGGEKWSLASLSCYFGIDYIENFPKATPEEISSACSSRPVGEYCLQAIEAYKKGP